MNGQVFIIGMGLIGGSLALCIKEEHPEAKVAGFDVEEHQLNLALRLGIIDELAATLEEGAREADLIIIAAPVASSAKILKRLAEIPMKKNVIVTDTGSTKGFITDEASCLTEKGIDFVGGHPMAGSHKSGVAAAKKILFENAFYLLTPAKGTKQQAITQLKSWLEGTKARFLEVSGEEHDYLTGVISHFPHIIAASLVHQAKKAERGNELVSRLAAGGFRDITRIASSSPKMWRDILLHNSGILLSLLEDWQAEMAKVSKLLREEDGEEIYEYFKTAKDFRDGLPVNDKGAIPSFYDLFVDVPDYPGVISEITGYLAEERISITNIRILETREEIYGVLVISFQTPEDRKRAIDCIEKKTDYGTSIGE
ncbi:prephenate dehydrogenase [Bacillus sp. REN3]|uniref:prephenate dehydrogenase n=1 Tax=Bacillus sp. REN3 TaxID=2802440 RepID=UPI001AEE5A17|nr:prephenate dehydrogenase [Bacillus sp. REN3]